MQVRYSPARLIYLISFERASALYINNNIAQFSIPDIMLTSNGASGILPFMYA
jgi:hypothetical protein